MQSVIELKIKVYNIYIYIYVETALQMNLGGTQGEFYMQAKWDYLNRVHSDQMVLKIVRQMGLCQPCEQWPKATQGRPSGYSPLRSDGSCDGQAGRLDCCEAVASGTQK
jgi:hypothetical protein